jgi:hypothetical protein
LKLRLMIVAGVLAIGFVVSVFTATVASADPGVGPNGEFLCPAVGNATAAEANGQGWGSLPNENYTFLPGNNQAGNHANSNALNTEGPGQSPGPGNGNSNWSPIWPTGGDN